MPNYRDDNVLDAAAEKDSFAQEITRQRKALGFSQPQIAKLARVSLVTWNRWEKGRQTPPPATIEGILSLLERLATKPSPKRRRALKEEDHLYFEQDKGFRLRETINIGRKVDGVRKKFPLYTRDQELAAYGKKVAHGVLRVLGLKIANRKQKPTGKKGPAARIDPVS